MQCSFSDTGLPPAVAAVAPRLLPVAADGDVVPARYRRAAVLILLFERDGATRFLLTERPATLSRHAGQISLPGGRIEPDDPSAWHAALRETHEELGITSEGIVPLGRLPATTIRASGYSVAPFVAWRRSIPSIYPDPIEVAAVIEPRLEALLDISTIRSEMWPLRGAEYRVTYFLLEGRQVWGATARILYELALRLGAAPVTPAPGSVIPSP